MKYIPLTQNKQVCVDDEDYEALAKHRWCYTNGYAARRKGSGDTHGHEYMHKRLMQSEPGDVILHIDGDKLNCCRANMMKTDKKLRQQRMAPRSASGFKGVTRRASKWAAHIGVGGKTIHLGRFADKDDAAREYDKAALKYYGPAAQLNFPAPAVETQQMTQDASVA